MKAQERHQKQYSMAMQMHYNGRTHSQILMRLQNAFVDAISARTLSNWISNFKSLDKEGISRDAPFQLHLIEEYGLPIEASSYISEMIYELTTDPRLPIFPSNLAYEGIDSPWTPTVREIDWWWRVHIMADDFSYQDVYLVASHYYVRDLLEEIGGIPADYSDLNAFMTYKPWISYGRTASYKVGIEWGKFTAIKADNYSTRGIFNQEGEWAIGDSVRTIWTWSQMPDGKYLSPHKALTMTIILSGKLPMASSGLPTIDKHFVLTENEQVESEIFLDQFNTLGQQGNHEILGSLHADYMEWITALGYKRGLKVPSSLVKVIDRAFWMYAGQQVTIDDYENYLWPVFEKWEIEAIKEHINQNSELE